MGGGTELPKSCQAWVRQSGRVNPQGNPWATASSLGLRNLGPLGESAKNPCQPLLEAAKVSVAQPYDRRTVGRTESLLSILV